MLYVLLPAYDEAQALPRVLARIRAVMAEHGIEHRIVVVDDGSRDGTDRVLQQLAAELPDGTLAVLTHRYNRGLGETIRDGIEHIAALGAADDVLLRMDCDDTHDPAYVPAMLAKLDEGYDVVTTSRYATGGGQVGVPWHRRALSRGANLLMRLAFPIRGLREYSCGYRAYRVGLLQQALAAHGDRLLALRGFGFAGTVEKLVKLHALGARCGEVPFVLRYDRKPGVSKARALRTALGYLVLAVRRPSRARPVDAASAASGGPPAAPSVAASAAGVER